MDLGTTLRQSAAQNPRKPALVCGDQAISYESLNRSTDALGRWLLGQGLEPGDRVAIHWQNAVETVNLYFACFKAGLIAVPVIAAWVGHGMAAPQLPTSWTVIIVAGLLVGFGTRLGAGCTSGHGICGIGRLSPRSIVATIVFMATAVVTVAVMRHGLGG